MHKPASYWKCWKSSVFLKKTKSGINYIHVASKFRIDFVNGVFSRILLFHANSPVFIYSFYDIKNIAVEWSKLKRSRMTWITFFINHSFRQFIKCKHHLCQDIVLENLIYIYFHSSVENLYQMHNSNYEQKSLNKKQICQREFPRLWTEIHIKRSCCLLW